MLYMVTFTINIPQMLAYIPYMDPMGMTSYRVWPQSETSICCRLRALRRRNEELASNVRLLEEANSKLTLEVT